MAVVGMTVGVVVIAALLAVIIFLYIRGKKLQQQLSKHDIREFMKGISDEVVMQQSDHTFDKFGMNLPYDKTLEINKAQLKIDYNKILGMGQFGCVYNARIGPGSGPFQQVALKMAKNDCPRSALKGLLSEIKILMYIGKHEYIVVLKGAYTKELQKGIVYIATELCILGSLEGFLRKQATNVDNPLQPEKVTFRQMVKWSYQIACGMAYLEAINVVHADLAARNVLLTENKTAKISDFGLSRRMYNYTSYVKTQQEPLPWRWMAIESLKRCEFSAKSDVWSYGITLWEIYSMGDSPYSGLQWTTDFVNILVNGLRLARPSYATPKLYKLMVDCWHTEADERPSFSIIQNEIKSIIFKCEEDVSGTKRYVNVQI